MNKKMVGEEDMVIEHLKDLLVTQRRISVLIESGTSDQGARNPEFDIKLTGAGTQIMRVQSFLQAAARLSGRPKAAFSIEPVSLPLPDSARWELLSPSLRPPRGEALSPTRHLSSVVPFSSPLVGGGPRPPWMVSGSGSRVRSGLAAVEPDVDMDSEDDLPLIRLVNIPSLSDMLLVDDDEHADLSVPSPPPPPVGPAGDPG